jgi:hypothetical protein
VKLPAHLPGLCLLGVLMAGSTALGVYYYYVYNPPLEAAGAFLDAMQREDADALAQLVRISPARDTAALREPTGDEIARLLEPPFEAGRILDQRKREGPQQAFHYLVYREPDGQVYAIVVAERHGTYHVIIPEEPASDRHWYLWDYTWTN